MRNNRIRATSFITAGAMLLSVVFPALNLQAEGLSVPGGTAGVTQFMDCFEPMPIVESLSTDCWGAGGRGARPGQWAGGHWGQDGISGWQGSQAVYAVSDNLYGPYEDKGPIWPDWCDIAIADSLAGTWDVKLNGLWWQVPGMATDNVEDPVIWYSDGLYHIVVNKWDARMAYYLTSKDGITNWKRHPGTAYTPDEEFLRYTDGTVNNWTKIERPNIYVEAGKIKAMTFAVIDVQKESDFGNDQHGSKVIVVPFSSEKLTAFSQQPDPLENRGASCLWRILIYSPGRMKS